jgi:hypothetical protein
MRSPRPSPLSELVSDSRTSTIWSSRAGDCPILRCRSTHWRWIYKLNPILPTPRVQSLRWSLKLSSKCSWLLQLEVRKLAGQGPIIPSCLVLSSHGCGECFLRTPLTIRSPTSSLHTAIVTTMPVSSCGKRSPVLSQFIQKCADFSPPWTRYKAVAHPPKVTWDTDAYFC